MSLLTSFRNPVKPILVVGDVMLDHYRWGYVKADNPESDAPNFVTIRKEYLAGGAANVALNLRALGAPVILGGVVGNDDAYNRLEAILNAQGIQTHFVRDGRQTTLKTRYLLQSTGQHTFRDNDEAEINEGEEQEINDSLADDFVSMTRHSLSSVSAVVFSDYAKGFLTDHLAQTLLAISQYNKLPTLVDTKPKKLARYTGSTVLKPNRREAQQIVNAHLDGCLPNYKHPIITDFCQRLRQHTGTEYVFVTCGEEGILAIDPENTISYAPALPCAHPDVTGAGDTIMALLTLGFAHHGRTVPVQELLHLANAGGHTVVNKRGTSTVTLDEITAVLAKRF